jgi:hypothetical protein
MFESTAVPTLFSFLPFPSLSSSCQSFHFPTKLNKRNTRGRTRLSLDQVSRANQSTWQVTRCFSLSLSLPFSGPCQSINRCYTKHPTRPDEHLIGSNFGILTWQFLDNN